MDPWAFDEDEETQVTDETTVVEETLLWCFGKNKDGELGLRHNRNVLQPEAMKQHKSKIFSHVSSGGSHSAIVDSHGRLYLCGSALHGKLGLEKLNKVSTSTFTIFPQSNKKGVLQVECGDYHTLCLLEDGKVCSWGGTLHKKLGNKGSTPSLVTGIGKAKIVKIGCGDFHSAALNDQGELYTWGGGGSHFNKGQCGHGTFNDAEAPDRVSGLDDKHIVDVACGGYHTLCIAQEDESHLCRVFSWGSGYYGQLGNGENTDVHSPVEVLFRNKGMDGARGADAGDSMKIVSVSAGGHHSVLLSEHGYVYTFGSGANGQLGHKTISNKNEPALVYQLSNKNVVQVSAGWNHTVVLTKSHNVYTAGLGQNGQLGHGDEESKKEFSWLKTLGGKKVQKIFAGGHHTWCMLDPQERKLKNYCPPSPLKTSMPTSPSQGGHSRLNRDHSQDGSVMRDKRSRNDLGLEHMGLHVIFSDQAKSHRFVRVTVEDKFMSSFNRLFAEYIKKVETDDGGMMFYNIQKDDDLFQIIEGGQTKNVSTPIEGMQRFTVMMIFSVGTMYNGVSGETHMITSRVKPKTTTIGPMYVLNETDIKSEEYLSQTCFWYLTFAQFFNGIVKSAKFLELRPSGK